MDRTEAKSIVEGDLEYYRSKPYSELESKVGETEYFERVSSTGEPYQLQIIFVHDDSETKNVRVIGNVSYSGWTDFFPVSIGFIIAPDGTFVGE